MCVTFSSVDDFFFCVVIGTLQYPAYKCTRSIQMANDFGTGFSADVEREAYIISTDDIQIGVREINCVRTRYNH